jgi:hypothetical protein
MSVAIILRIREKYIERIRLHARFGSMEGCKLEGRMTSLGARARATRCVLPPEMQECPRGTMEEST